MSEGISNLVAMTHHILHGHDLIRTDPVTWRQWFKTADRIVARAQVNPDVLISTVFVGLDLGCDPGKPLVFETEVMEAGASSGDARRVRYSTWSEAKRGHAAIVAEY